MRVSPSALALWAGPGPMSPAGITADRDLTDRPHVTRRMSGAPSIEQVVG